jgi:hypothetical protein
MRAFLMYIDDWLASKKIARMDAYEERGYLRLLLRAASEPDCGLPDNDAELAIYSKLGQQWYRQSKDKDFRIDEKTSGQKLRDCFFVKDGRLFNERLLREFEHQQEVQAKRAKAGVAGNEKRWGKRSDPTGEDHKRVANESQMGSQTVSQNDPNDVWVYSFKFSKDKLLELQGCEVGELWNSYWSIFIAAGKAVNNRDEERALRKFLSFNRDNQIAALADAQQKSTDGTWPNEHLTPNPFNHLSGESWTRVAAKRTLPTHEKKTPGQAKYDAAKKSLEDVNLEDVETAY